MDWPSFYQNEVLPRLRPEGVFTDPSHDWKSRKDRRWKGSCPWHGSESGTCFTIDPGTLEWYCFHCKRGGGPAEYLHGLNGGRGTPEGKDFIAVVTELAATAGIEVPEESDPREKKSDDRRPRERQKVPGTRETQKKVSVGGGQRSGVSTAPCFGQSEKEPNPKYTERKMRNALLKYREALESNTESARKARAYVEARGFSMGTLVDYGCGFAPPGEWLQDDITNEDGKRVHRAPNGRIVTPHLTPSGTLVSLSGRAVPPCPDWKQKRNLDGNPTGLFNAPAIREGSGPLVVCEAPLDALSFIEAGHARTVALHGTTGVPWTALRGSAGTVILAFDDDETGREDGRERARQAALRGHDAHVLPGAEEAYGGHEDPNDALQNGDLDLSYIEELQKEPGRSKSEVKQTGKARNSTETRPTLVGAPRDSDEGGRVSGECDLIARWNGTEIGELGTWFCGADLPDGPACGALYCDEALRRWIRSELQAGPEGASDPDRLRGVLWRLYAAFGAEKPAREVLPSDVLASVQEEQSTGGDPWARGVRARDVRDRDPYKLGPVPGAVKTSQAPSPKTAPGDAPRGIAVDAPFSEAFVQDLKTLPEWARTWTGDVWIVDDAFAAFVGDLVREHFG